MSPPKRQGGWSRRHMLQGGVAGLLTAGALPLATPFADAAERVRTTIKDVQTMTVQGAARTYVYVRIVAADGRYGVAEGYGSPAVGTAEQIMALKPWLVGKDPLEIDVIYTFLGRGERNLSGTRTDGSAHNLMRAASAIDMALWDLAGKLLDTPASVLLGGRFRDQVRVYDHAAPANMLDKASCRDWAARVKAHPSGFTAHKLPVPRTDSIWRNGRSGVSDEGRDLANRRLTTRELINIAQGFENAREAIGWDHDLMVHCLWEFDLESAIQLAEAVAPIKPLWIEDPLQVDYTDAWKRLVDKSPAPILTGENLSRREGFAPFLLNQGCDIINPDLRNSGGFLETKRIADMATLYGIPVATHGTGSQVYTYQVCQWAASIRDFMICETITGEGDWMDHVVKLDDGYVRKGYVKVSDKPGTGVELDRQVVEAHLAPGERWWGDL